MKYILPVLAAAAIFAAGCKKEEPAPAPQAPAAPAINIEQAKADAQAAADKAKADAEAAAAKAKADAEKAKADLGGALQGLQK